MTSLLTYNPPVSQDNRERFDTYELVIVLSNYDVGVVQKMHEFPRGSRKSPKLLIQTDTGTYLLKRRPRAKESPYKVAFCHSLQLYLASKQFPLPHLIGTRRTNNSMFQWQGAIYEMFEYFKGNAFDESLEATADAGKTLAVFHKLLADFEPDFETPKGSYHASASTLSSLQAAPDAIIKADPKAEQYRERITQCAELLKDIYQRSSVHVNNLGLKDWPQQVIHTDWHAGNMLFRGDKVAAVTDYDNARIMQRVLDVANGALQFSRINNGGSPRNWPAELDMDRLKQFLGGYDATPGCVLSKVELDVIPWLMIEALVTEAALPIGRTGVFGRYRGAEFLHTAERRARWMEANHEAITGILD